MTDLLYSDVEDQLRASVRDLLAKQAPVAETLKRVESGEPYDPALWRALAVDIGVSALAVPEDRGGHGATWREVAVVAEELGASLAPTPFLGHTMATVAARISGVREVIVPLVNGQRVGTLAVPAGVVWGSSVSADDGVVSGVVRGVADAITADVFLVPTDAGMHVVEAEHVTRTRVESLDMTRPLCDLTFERAPASQLQAQRGGLRDGALLIGGAMLASEQLGVAQRCLDMTVDYLKTRYQFGRQIGSYQALKHRVADLWAAVTQARAVARYAAACVADHDGDAPVAVEMALAYCSPVAVKAAEECVQLHGGIGFTWEHPAHLYLKRAKANSLLLRSPRQHRARLGELVGLPSS
ncbi:MAG TPA: acyl-CoA dehydrogenase family protein [Jatrophihabitantaceae bacterium]|nr:acyl-CoA dehydrogenase family protein [Jatrophihabitantaceae bacterium]